MNVEQIARQLGKARYRHGEWTCCCPAHEDTNPSLSLTEKNGMLLVHCHAGCPQEKVIDALRRRGLWPEASKNRNKVIEEGGPGRHGSPSTAQRSGCTVDEYARAKGLPPEFLTGLGVANLSYMGSPAISIPYRDKNGDTFAVRIRVAIAGSDKHRWRKGDKPGLYGLDRLRPAGDRGIRSITLVEGESDAQTLWFNGLEALGIPGASMWQEKRDVAALDGFSEIFVIVEPDGGGEALRATLKQSKIRDRVKLVRLDPFKDVSELYLDDPEAFPERWRDACARAIPWLLEEAKERERERAKLFMECEALAHSQDILAEFSEELENSGAVGVRRPGELLFLVVTSRLLPRPVSAVVKGLSSSGKSYLVDRVLKFFPEEAFLTFTAMSEHALVYSNEPLKNRVLIIFELPGIGHERGAYFLRSLLSEGRLVYEVVVKGECGPETIRIEKEGPTGLILTTTLPRLKQDEETRLLSIRIEDTTEQTREIMRAHAGPMKAAPEYDRWHAFQRVLALGVIAVHVPFAGRLANLIPANSVRLRRDFPMLLTLIRAHALIHQCMRKRDAKGEIIAEVRDYEVVRQLVGEYFAQGIEASVPKGVREVVEVVDRLTRRRIDVSNSIVAKELGLDKSAASRRIKEALLRDYLRNDEDKHGRPAKLRLGEPLPDETNVLPYPDELE